MEVATSTGSSTASVYAPKYHNTISDNALVLKMTPAILMHYDSEVFMTNIRDADNPLCWKFMFIFCFDRSGHKYNQLRIILLLLIFQ